ncbi:MAG: lipid-A-disaccharide synthase, partial [Phenylobacterium sp.]|nr:lipid-A-disaccharide synthase [Phenylobacterium sp.]
EASGDDRGANLARALKRRLGEGVRLVGVGGSRMRAEGVESPFDISELSILGLLEGLLAWRKVVLRAEETAALAARERPDVAVLIDSWGFTLRVAQRLRRKTPSLPIVKYVAPQVWASRPGRAKTAAQAFDLLLTIHIFDAPAFEREGLRTVFVGDSTLALDFSQADPGRLRDQIGAKPDAPILLVAPGSRPSEIQRVLPAFEDAVRILKAARPELCVVVPAAPTVAEAVRARVASWPEGCHVVEGETAKRDAMVAARVALACSGTVTTELALAGAALVVGYRLGPVTHTILKRLIRTKYVTLFNIAAQDFVAPELIQDDCNGPDLAREVALRLDDLELSRRQVERQSAALMTMGRGGPDPSEAAVDAILALFEAQSRPSVP